MFSAFASRVARLGRSTPPSKRNRQNTRLSIAELERRDQPATGLGVANDYGAFILDDANVFYSDVQGKFAIGDDASITGYSVGDQLHNSNGTQASLIVGGDLIFTNGQVNAGNVVYGGTAYFDMFGLPNGSKQQGTPLDFNAAGNELRGLADSYAALASNGTVKNQYGIVTLTGTNPGQNVFNIPSSMLWNANTFTIKAPAGSSVIVNITGTSARMQYMGYNLQGGVDNDNVILNFHNAENLTLAGIGIFGNVLAPRAYVDFSNGQINGTMVAESWCGYGQINYEKPDCPPPPPPCEPPPPPPCEPEPPVCEPPPPPCEPPPPPPCEPEPPVCEPPPPPCEPEPPVCEPEPPVCEPPPPPPCEPEPPVCEPEPPVCEPPPPPPCEPEPPVCEPEPPVCEPPPPPPCEPEPPVCEPEPPVCEPPPPPPCEPEPPVCEPEPPVCEPEPPVCEPPPPPPCEPEPPVCEPEPPPPVDECLPCEPGAECPPCEPEPTPPVDECLPCEPGAECPPCEPEPPVCEPEPPVCEPPPPPPCEPEPPVCEPEPPVCEPPPPPPCEPEPPVCEPPPPPPCEPEPPVCEPEPPVCEPTPPPPCEPEPPVCQPKPCTPVTVSGRVDHARGHGSSKSNGHVTVTLTGTDDNGKSATHRTRANIDGTYVFENVSSGKYSVRFRYSHRG